MKRWAYIHVGATRKLPNSNSEVQASEAMPLLIEALFVFSPQISVSLSTPFKHRGLWIELGRSAHLFGGELALINHILQCAEALGFSTNIILATQPESAFLLSLVHSSLPLIVPPGRDAELLANLPTSVLQPSVKAQKFFKRIGVENLQDLSRLTPSSLSQRIGPEGATLVRLARADTFAPPSPYNPPEHPLAQQDFDPPIPPEEGLIFALKRLLIDLVARVRGRGCAVTQMNIEVQTSGSLTYKEAITLPRPLSSDSALLSIIRLRLSDILKPEDPYLIPEQYWIERLSITITGLCPAPGCQRGFFERSEQNYEALAELLGRLSIHLGEERASGISMESTHRPEKAWRPTNFLAHQEQAQLPSPKDIPPRPTFLLPTPLPVEGLLQQGALLRWTGGRGRVSSFWGPERLRGEWWKKPFARDYFVTSLEQGERLWLYRDLYTKKLYLHGIFD